MNQKTVSVIVTCYNLEQEIGRCIESLRRQTYDNLQIIVIDDGSKDNSFQVIKQIAETDSRIHPVYQQNQGVSAARNNGISLATGNFLLFIDGDDYVSDTYVEHFMKASDGSDMVIGGLRYVYPDQSETVVTEDVFCCSKDEYVKNHYTTSVARRTIFGPVNKLYRTSVIKENHIRFREGLEIREDGFFVLDVLNCTTHLCGIAHAGYYYIQSAPNASLISKFHAAEKEINAQFFEMLIGVIGRDHLTDRDIRLIYPMFLNMDIASVRKLYNSKEYSLHKGLQYIRSILCDDAFCHARAKLKHVAPKQAAKYYRPLWMVHIINYLMVRIKK